LQLKKKHHLGAAMLRCVLKCIHALVFIPQLITAASTGRRREFKNETQFFA
jgi:hypothetical protein